MVDHFSLDSIFESEKSRFSPYAKLSNETKGRVKSEKPSPTRTEFQRDRDRIIYSRAFIRLKNKTQVFFSPEGDHYMTRLTHTLDVSQIARSISRCLYLNEDLTEAIALGHDLGHTPFGHSGERCLNKLSKNGFRHNEQSLRVVDILENDLNGLNLTYEVRDGILNHKMSLRASTLEGRVVSLSDRIAYLNHDVDDAIRAGLIKLTDLPEKTLKNLGSTSSERINSMVNDVLQHSFNKDEIIQSIEIKETMMELRQFMFDRVYITDKSKIEEERAYNMIEALFNFFKNNVDKLPQRYKTLLNSYDVDTVLCDYLSSMTDRYVISVFKSIFIPENFYF